MQERGRPRSLKEGQLSTGQDQHLEVVNYSLRALVRLELHCLAPHRGCGGVLRNCEKLTLRLHRQAETPLAYEATLRPSDEGAQAGVTSRLGQRPERRDYLLAEVAA